MCDEEYDAVFTNAKNELYVLHDYENLWKFDIKNKSWIKEDLWSTYRGIEDGVRGGVIDKNKITWFFKGKQQEHLTSIKLIDGLCNHFKNFQEDSFTPLRQTILSCSITPNLSGTLSTL